MPKTSLTTDFSDYAPVADRIALFYEKHPTGQILTDLISRADGEITFRARIFRTPDERRPAATGWASEVVGDGDINEVACLENTETSAVGRALANLGFTASRLRPSAEEMLKVARTRSRLSSTSTTNRYFAPTAKPQVVRESGATSDHRETRANAINDALFLIKELERSGAVSDRLQEARQALAVPEVSMETIERIERALRRLLQDHRQNRRQPPPTT